MAIDDEIRNLSRIPIFSAIDENALRLIAFSAETRVLRAGDVLFRRGEMSDGGYVLLSGAVALDPADNGSAGVEMILPIALIGEVALLSDTERPVTAIARQPSSVMKITRSLFHRVLSESPASAVQLRAFISRRVSRMLGELDEISAGWTAEPPADQ
jgi:CRP-like cAMP-binding protein